MSKTFRAVSILIGTIIGAGVLGMPYVVSRSGFSLGVINTLLIALVMTITMLYLGEIALRTKTKHHLPGYANLYLGKKGKIVMFIALAFGIYSAVLAYLIGEGESLSYLFFNTPEFQFHFGIAFWIVLSLMTYFGLKVLEDGEEIGVILILIMIISVSVLCWNKIDVSNLSYSNPSMFFAPFGVILFAFLGFTAIPEVNEALGSQKRFMKRSIIIANLIVLCVYILFTAVVLGSQGLKTPSLATIGLGKAFILLGMFTMFTSYLSLSIALIDSLRYDFRLSKNKAWLATILVPLALFIILHFSNYASFTLVLGIGGVISGGLESILILLMVKKAKARSSTKPAYSIPYSRILTGILILLFIIGAAMEIYSTIS